MARKPRLRSKTTRARPLTVVEKISLRPRRRARPRRRVGKAVLAQGTGGFSVAQAVMPPAAAGSVIGRSIPMIRSDDTGAIVVQNTEMVASVVTNAAYNSAVIRIAPFSMPWLNGIASNYSKYKWISMRVVYVPACPTTTAGAVAMSYQYDDADLNPTSIAQMSMQHGFVSCPSWAGWEGSCLLAKPRDNPGVGAVVASLDTDRLDKPWYPYINSSNYTTLVGVATVGPAVGDTYVPAVLTYAVDAGPTVSVLSGYLYAQYEVALIEPIALALNF